MKSWTWKEITATVIGVVIFTVLFVAPIRVEALSLMREIFAFIKDVTVALKGASK